jgi:hypothetical protein
MNAKIAGTFLAGSMAVTGLGCSGGPESVDAPDLRDMSAAQTEAALQNGPGQVRVPDQIVMPAEAIQHTTGGGPGAEITTEFYDSAYWPFSIGDELYVGMCAADGTLSLEPVDTNGALRQRGNEIDRYKPGATEAIVTVAWDPGDCSFDAVAGDEFRQVPQNLGYAADQQQQPITQ